MPLKQNLRLTILAAVAAAAIPAFSQDVPVSHDEYARHNSASEPERQLPEFLAPLFNKVVRIFQGTAAGSQEEALTSTERTNLPAKEEDKPGAAASSAVAPAIEVSASPGKDVKVQSDKSHEVPEKTKDNSSSAPPSGQGAGLAFPGATSGGVTPLGASLAFEPRVISVSQLPEGEVKNNAAVDSSPSSEQRTLVDTPGVTPSVEVDPAEAAKVRISAPSSTSGAASVGEPIKPLAPKEETRQEGSTVSNPEKMRFTGKATSDDKASNTPLTQTESSSMSPLPADVTLSIRGTQQKPLLKAVEALAPIAEQSVQAEARKVAPVTVSVGDNTPLAVQAESTSSTQAASTVKPTPADTRKQRIKKVTAVIPVTAPKQVPPTATVANSIEPQNKEVKHSEPPAEPWTFTVPFEVSSPVELALMGADSWVEVYKVPLKQKDTALSLLLDQDSTPPALAITVGKTLFAEVNRKLVQSKEAKFTLTRKGKAIEYDGDCKIVPDRGDRMQVEYKGPNGEVVSLTGRLLQHHVFTPANPFTEDVIRVSSINKDNCNTIVEQRGIFEGTLIVKKNDQTLAQEPVIIQTVSQ